jgi:Co/Zn/Cd efflux system component
MSSENSSTNRGEQEHTYGFQSLQVRGKDREEDEDDDQIEEEHPHQNVQVLIFVVSLFSIFVVAEAIAAFSSHSLSLLGDVGATGVDVFTVSHKAKFNDC